MKRDKTAVPVATIGFTGKSAQKFFGLLRDAHVRTVLDVRLNNTSQLAGFAKKQDLPFFLEQLCNAAYVEIPELAPEPELLKRYQGKQLNWENFREEYFRPHRAPPRGEQSGYRAVRIGVPALQ